MAIPHTQLLSKDRRQKFEDGFATFRQCKSSDVGFEAVGQLLLELHVDSKESWKVVQASNLSGKSVAAELEHAARREGKVSTQDSAFGARRASGKDSLVVKLGENRV